MTDATDWTEAIDALAAADGPTSDAGSGSAVFRVPLAAGGDLATAAGIVAELRALADPAARMSAGLLPLDGISLPLRADIPGGYGESGVQATGAVAGGALSAVQLIGSTPGKVQAPSMTSGRGR